MRYTWGNAQASTLQLDMDMYYENDVGREGAGAARSDPRSASPGVLSVFAKFITKDVVKKHGHPGM